MIANTQELFSFICGQMDKLDKDDITVEKASAQAKLAKQATNVLNYELKRTVVELQLKQIDGSINPRLRDIESAAIKS